MLKLSGDRFSYVTGLFAVPNRQFLVVCSMYALLQVFHVGLYMPLLSRSCVVSWVLDLFGFCSLFTFKVYLNVGLFEEVDYVSNFPAVISERDRMFLLQFFVFVWVLRCICAINLAM